MQFIEISKKISLMDMGSKARKLKCTRKYEKF